MKAAERYENLLQDFVRVLHKTLHQTVVHSSGVYNMES